MSRDQISWTGLKSWQGKSLFFKGIRNRGVKGSQARHFTALDQCVVLWVIPVQSKSLKTKQANIWLLEWFHLKFLKHFNTNLNPEIWIYYQLSCVRLSVGKAINLLFVTVQTDPDRTASVRGFCLRSQTGGGEGRPWNWTSKEKVLMLNILNLFIHCCEEPKLNN